MKNSNKNILLKLFKFSIAILSFAFVFYKLKDYNQQEISYVFKESFAYYLIFIVLLLMFVNWAVEAIKWQYLVAIIEKINFLTSLKAVFSGLTFAIITPNRVGEIAGRSFVLQSKNRAKGIIATAIGSLSQMMVTVILGVIYGIIFLFFYEEKLQILNYRTLLFIKIFSVILLTSGLYIFFNLHILQKLFLKLKLPKKLIEAISILSKYKKSKMVKVLLLSFLRYFIFLSQYYLLLVLFKVEISFFEASIGIVLTYFISSAIPSFTFAEIGIRGTTAIFFIGFFSANIQGIIAATALLWIINLAIPAIIGAFLFYRTKV